MPSGWLDLKTLNHNWLVGQCRVVPAPLAGGAPRTWESVREDERGPAHTVGVFQNVARVVGITMATREGIPPCTSVGKGSR